MLVCHPPDDLKRFLDHELDAADSTAISEHKGRCAACQKLLGDYCCPQLASEVTRGERSVLDAE